MNDQVQQIQSSRDTVFQFCLSFVKALSHSGYYSPDHPQAKKAFQGLYSQFVQLVGDRPELTFFRMEDEGRPEILLEGLIDEAIKMSKLMTQQSGELFIPKLHQYFIRKKILSFTMKNQISETEFFKFIIVLSEVPDADTRKHQEEKDVLNMKLVEEGIINVSLLFEEDVIGKERRLPWRVEMALTRLRRDLRYIPLYKNLSEEELLQAKQKVFQDILRPLRQPHVLKDFLVHSDLIKVDDEILGGSSVESIIVEQIPEHMIPEVISQCLNDWEKYEKKSISSEDEQFANILHRIKQATMSLADFFKGKTDPKHHKTLKMLLSKNVISFKELPRDLMQDVLINEWIEDYLNSPKQWFKLAQNSKDLAQYSKIIRKMSSILPLLVEREEIKHVLTIIEFLKEQLMTQPDPFSKIGTFLRQNLNAFASNKIAFSNLKTYCLDAEREDRSHVFDVLDHFKKISIPILLDLLKESERKSVRKQAIERLVSYKQHTLPFLKKIIEDPQNPWFVVRNAVHIASEIGDKQLCNIIEPLFKHEKHQVREEALDAFFKLNGQEGLDYYIAALNDPELSVKLKAISIIGYLKITDQQILSYYGQYLSYPASVKEMDHESIQLQILKAVENIDHNITWNNEETIEELLLKIAAESDASSSLKKVFMKRAVRSPKVIAAAKMTLQRMKKKERTS